MSDTNSNTLPARLPMPRAVVERGKLDADGWRVLCDVVWPSAKSAESVALAFDYCRVRGLDPFKKPVHIVPTWNNELGREVESIWPGINEVQVTAARSGTWAGMDEPRWGPTTMTEFTGKNGKVRIRHPEWCAVTVYRIVQGKRCGFCEPVYWLEAYASQGKYDAPNKMWAKRPFGQLLKCAKAASLRAAFPEESGGMPTGEEMEGKEIEAGGIVIDGKAEPAAPDHDPITGEVIEPAPRKVAYKLHQIVTADGTVHGTSNDPRQLLRLYGEAKRQPPIDAMRCAIRNLDVLRSILPHVGGSTAERLKREIEAAEAIKMQSPVDLTGDGEAPAAKDAPAVEVDEAGGEDLDGLFDRAMEKEPA